MADTSDKVEIKVTQKGINKTVKDLNNISKKLSYIVANVTEEGAKYCKEIAPVYSGELKGSIYGGLTSPTHGFISSYSEHAKYAEFGVGIVAQNNPHPNIDPTEYDINHHELNGWTYYDDYAGKFVHTIGYVGNAFFYRTCEYLKNRLGNIVKVVLKK